MLTANDPINIVITGVGGQGNVLASQILGQALIDQGYKITIGETLGLSQRGGSVMSHIRVSKTHQLSPQIPEGGAHLILALEPVEGLRVMGEYANPEVRLIVNPKPVSTLDVAAGNAEYPELEAILAKMTELSAEVHAVPATEIGLELGNPIFSNIVILGAVAKLGLLPLSRDGFEAVIAKMIPEDKIARNLEAFDRGGDELEKVS